MDDPKHAIDVLTRARKKLDEATHKLAKSIEYYHHYLSHATDREPHEWGELPPPRMSNEPDLEGFFDGEAAVNAVKFFAAYLEVPRNVLRKGEHLDKFTLIKLGLHKFLKKLERYASFMMDALDWAIAELSKMVRTHPSRSVD